jgi:hypothetical protein
MFCAGGTLNRIGEAALTAVFLLIGSSIPLFSAAPDGARFFPALDSLSHYAVPAASEMVFPLPGEGRFSGEKLSGEQLFQELHNAVAPTVTPAPSYQQAKAYMYSTANNTDCGGAPGILTFYSQVCAAGSSSSGNDYHEQGDQNGDGVVDKIVNTEHIWPQSFFNSDLPMVSDLHQLEATFETPNSRRANLRFAVVSNAVYSTKSGSKLGAEGFEPADAVKGNVARAVMYFVVRYYDRSIRNGMDYQDFWAGRVAMFLKWNRQDPPDAAERRRNDLVESFQGNRNPFIDDPSLADQIGEVVFRAH